MIGVLEEEELKILRTQCKHYERQTQLLRQTLRDEFAMRAMNGLISSDTFHGPIYQQRPDLAADFAYKVADAMLEARK